MKKDQEADVHLPKTPQVETPSRAPTPHTPVRERGDWSRERRGGARVHREQEELMVAQEMSPGSGNRDSNRQAATKTTGITRTHTHTQTQHRSGLDTTAWEGGFRRGTKWRTVQRVGCGKTQVLDFSGKSCCWHGWFS